MSKGAEDFLICCTHVVINIVEQQRKGSAAKLANLAQEGQEEKRTVQKLQTAGDNSQASFPLKGLASILHHKNTQFKK